MRTLIIIPAYNEEENIERVVNNIISNYGEYDYIIVNDGSTDKTKSICTKNSYNLIDLPVNLGLAGAFQTGIKYAILNHYDAILQFDGDGQHKPEYIKSMEEKMLQTNAEIIIGSRFYNSKKETTLRNFGNTIISKIIKITTGKTIKDPTSGMRLFSSKILSEFCTNINYGPEPDTISYLIKNGANVQEVQVSMDARIAGESYLNLKSSIKYMFFMSLSILYIQQFRGRGK